MTADECRNPSCGDHPHCPFDDCGQVMVDDGSGELVCPDGCADALAEESKAAAEATP